MMLFLVFFTDTATTELYTLSLHDALPISCLAKHFVIVGGPLVVLDQTGEGDHLLLRLLGRFLQRDRKSTRLNSSHEWISYAVFCLKKKKRQSVNTCNSQRST